MKKVLILLISAVLLLALLPSCNQNVKDGVFAQVVQSAESSKYVIKTYLGNVGANYYFLETTGVFCNGTNIIEGNYADAYIAATENTNPEKMILLDNFGNTWEYSFKTKRLSSAPTHTGVVAINGNNNGFIVVNKEDTTDKKKKNFLYQYKQNTNKEDALAKGFDKVLYSDDAVLLFTCTSTANNTENWKNYLCTMLWTTEDDNWNKWTEENLGNVLDAKQVVGFERAGSSDVYYVACSNNNYVYRLSKSAGSYGAVKISNTIYSPREVDSQMPSFSYVNTAGNDVVVFRSASYYEEFVENGGFKSYNAKQDGWATYLHTYDLTVVDILPATDNTDFILATHKNGLYRFNPTSNKLINDGQIKF